MTTPVSLLFSVVLLFLSWSDEAGIRITGAALQWYNISQAVERGALCNDFTTPGYFIRQSMPQLQMESKWVIYLEGGGACSTPQSCNERFIDQSIRERYTYKGADGSAYVDIKKAWSVHKSQPLKVISKLMTTLWRFSIPGKEGSPGNWTIEGSDILSPNPVINPDFYSHNHIIVPYCSSDLWLRESKNYVLAQDPDFQFKFDPDLVTEHQFTFRGVAIFRSVIQDLFDHHGLGKAAQVILSGSSAGGIGVMNHAKWLREKLDMNSSVGCTLLALLDSSWFIDFKNSFQTVLMADEFQQLADTGEILESCALTGIHSFSTCFSAASILPNSMIYPNIPTLAIFSIYDVYSLVTAIRSNNVNTDILELMRVVSEYGGSMNTSLLIAKERFGNLSLYVTSCLQHVYLATSSLWGTEQESVFGNAAIEHVEKNNRFM